MLLDFQDDVDRRRHLESVADDSQVLIDRRDAGRRKLHVDRRTGNLNDMSNIFWHKVRLALVSLAISIQHSVLRFLCRSYKILSWLNAERWLLNADCCSTALLPR